MNQCAGGACVNGCPGGTRNCNDACVNTSTDALNCGGCGNLCARDEVCVSGSCRAYYPATCASCPCDPECNRNGFEACCGPYGTASSICVDRAPGQCP